MADAQDLVNQVDSSIAAMQSDARAAMDSLQVAAGLPFLSWFDFSAVTPFTPTAPGALSLGTVAALKTIDTTMAAPTTRTSLSLSDLPQLQRAVLELGDTPVLAYTPDLLNGLKTRVISWVDSGGVNISAGVQQAVFDTARERTLQAAQDALDLAGARTGAKGFRYPNSMTKAAQHEIIVNVYNQREDLNRAIIKEFADMAQKNIQMALSAGVEAERISSEIAIRVATFALETQKMLLDKFRIETEAFTKEYEETLRALLANLDAEKMNYSVYLDYLQALRAQFDIQQRTEISRFEGDLKLAVEKLTADRTNAELQMEVQKLFYQVWNANMNIITERGKAQITQAEEANRVKLSAIEGLVRAYVELIQNMSAQAVAIVTKKT